MENMPLPLPCIHPPSRHGQFPEVYSCRSAAASRSQPQRPYRQPAREVATRLAQARLQRAAGEHLSNLVGEPALGLPQDTGLRVVVALPRQLPCRRVAQPHIYACHSICDALAPRLEAHSSELESAAWRQSEAEMTHTRQLLPPS